MPRRLTNLRPNPLQTAPSDSVGEHPIDIVIPNESGPTTPLLTLYPTSYDSLSACAHIQYRILMCKYRCGLSTSAREKQSVERAMRRVNREINRASSQVTPGTNSGNADGFYVVDMEQGTVRDPSLGKPLNDRNKMTATETFTTILLRFPLYVVFIIFMSVYDVLFDGVFRQRVRTAISMTPLEADE